MNSDQTSKLCRWSQVEEFDIEEDVAAWEEDEVGPPSKMIWAHIGHWPK